MTQPNQRQLAIVPESEYFNERAQAVSERLNIPCLELSKGMEIDQYDVVVWIGGSGIGIKQIGKKAPNPVFVDFLTGSLAHRNKYKANAKELIVKAVGIKLGECLNVLDATAGLGRDAFILSAFGCNVHMLERSPIVHTLLEDGLERASIEPEVAPIIARMKLSECDAMDYLRQLKTGAKTLPDVIYLDPMFPERSKSAKVKKEMRVLQLLLTEQPVEEGLLALAKKLARKRVVVKRPRLAPCLDENTPSFSITGKSSRFDVYQTFNEG